MPPQHTENNGFGVKDYGLAPTMDGCKIVSFYFYSIYASTELRPSWSPPKSSQR